MTDRITPIRKTPAEILADLMAGHGEARLGGAEKGMKYLLNFVGRASSIPNAVEFFLYDLLAEDAFRCGDLEACRGAVAKALGYLPVAREETPQGFRAYGPSIRVFERGITRDEYFVSEQAATEGVRVVNASETDPIVMLKHFGPDNPDLGLA